MSSYVTVTGLLGSNTGADGITVLTLAPLTCNGGLTPLVGGGGTPMALENGGGGAILALRFFFINSLINAYVTGGAYGILLANEAALCDLYSLNLFSFSSSLSSPSSTLAY